MAFPMMDHWIYEKTKDGEGLYDIYSRLLQDRIIFLGEEIDADVASKVIASLLYLDKKDKVKEIVVYINSPGGDFSSGMAIYDMFQFISAPIKTICIGQACSAAADLLAAGTKGKRLCMPHAEIMIHSFQAELAGSNKDIQLEYKWLQRQHVRSVELLARHTGQTIDKVAKDCERDKYMDAEEALAYGMIDKIIKPHKRLPMLKKK